VSGGATPRRMLRRLADEAVPWEHVHLFQVDERVAPAGHAERNLTQLGDALLAHLRVPPAGVHAMPVEDADLGQAAAAYAARLRDAAGDPAVLDLVHLGLGDDGHTASLVPDDATLEAIDDVSVTAPYRGYRRMTLTFPIINRTRAILWIVTGAAKRGALARLRRGDASLPAGRVRRDGALIIADASANPGGVDEDPRATRSV
ncbi:MAG: 6-phosphogluconolactonase, partial [Deltaproteobacteria bacterium]|nr:6-phosphogluconolactonase [Kofleriaceae bacterium]